MPQILGSLSLSPRACVLSKVAGFSKHSSFGKMCANKRLI